MKLHYTFVMALAASALATSRAYAQPLEHAEADPAANAADGTAVVYHVPLAEASAGDTIAIEARIGGAFREELELRVRGGADGSWQAFPFQRTDDGGYRAVVPGEAVQPPGFTYYIVGRAAQGEVLHFANAENPHRVRVSLDEEVELRERELERSHHRRYQARVATEYVDFGRRTIVDLATGQEHSVPDSYYRIDGEFGYRVLRYPLRALRFGYVRLLGTTPATARGDGVCPTPEDGEICRVEAGFRAGGWAELRWRLTEILSADTRILFLATPSSVGLGARGELRFGDAMGSHFALGFEGISEVGSNTFVRLAWATVPKIPMAATVELTDYPSSHRDTGVRLLYDIGYDHTVDLGDHTAGIRFGARVGYQARDQGIGGMTGGLNVTLDF